MNRKAYFGCKIQDTCYGMSMDIMHLKLENSKNANEASDATNSTAPAGDVSHGTKVLKELVEPWVVKGEIVVAEESYFASEKSAK